MKRILILCAMFVLSIAGTALAGSDRILMEQSTTELGSDESYTSDTYLAGTFKFLAVTVVSDQSSAAGGVKIEQSCDSDCDTAVSPEFQDVSEWTYTAGSGDNQYVAELNCKCARVSYENGTSAQGSFHITSYLAKSNYALLSGPLFTGDVKIDNQKEIKMYEADANGSNYVGFKVPASLSADLGLTWNITPSTCTGDGSGGALTVNGSNEIICSADNGGGSITVEESDANPTVSSVNKIQFNASHFTVTDETGGQVQIDSILSPLASALASNPTDCSANQYATTIGANGNLTCAQVTGSQVANTPAGNIAATTVQAAINELDSEKLGTSGNAATASALASNPTDCTSNQFANAIAANGNLTCAALVDADIPNTITIDAASALASNPTDCSAGQYATTIAANGNLTCAAVSASQVTNTPAGNIAATDVQTAINELDTEKAGLAGATFTGPVEPKVQSLTIADSGNGSHATDSSTTITGNTLAVTCSDADGCDLTLSETSVGNGRTLLVYNAGTSNTLYLVQSSGVAQMCAGATIPLAAKTSNITKSAELRYVSDRWQQDCRQTEWSDLNNVPAFRKILYQLRPQANEPPASSFAVIYSRNSHPGLSFDGDVCAVWSFVMPNWYGGNGVTAEIYYAATETTNDTDWDGSWERIETTEDIDNTSTFSTAISQDNNNNPGTSGVPLKVSIAFTNGSQMDSCAAGELCRFKLCRDATSDTSNNNNGNIVLIGGDLKETL